jgi:hypothetical protein
VTFYKVAFMAFIFSRMIFIKMILGLGRTGRMTLNKMLVGPMVFSNATFFDYILLNALL